MTDKQKQELLDDMLRQYQYRENDFPVIDSDGTFLLPILSVDGIRQSWERHYKPIRGIALEINDHGNVTVWNCFKNGNRREIASRV